jgi:spermidine synthase
MMPPALSPFVCPPLTTEELAALPELWITERYKGTSFGLQVKNTVYQAQSKWQRIDIVDSIRFGRTLLLDGMMMTTALDEFIYHELITHLPMMTLASKGISPKRVLVVGGGDGGTIREVLKYPDIEEAVLCELDEAVVRACQAHMPEWAACLDDARVTLNFGDAAHTVGQYQDAFDVILVDSTDPVGPGEVLFNEAFYSAVKSALKPHGIMTAQTESPLLEPEIFKMIQRRISSVFNFSQPVVSAVPSYPGAIWSWTLASREDISAPLQLPPWSEAILGTCRYYTPELHGGLLNGLPNYVKALCAA